MATINLAASPRALFGKKARFLRRAGITPANLYGAGVESTALQVETKALLRTIVATTRNTLVELTGDGEADSRTVFIWRVQRDPLTEEILHIDLFHVEATRTMRATVPVRLQNIDPELDKFSKRVNQFLNEVEVETLPADLPEEILLDVSALQELDDDIAVGAITISDKVTILTDPELVIAKVGEIVDIVEEEPEEALEGAGEGEGEGEAPEAGGDTPREAPEAGGPEEA